MKSEKIPSLYIQIDNKETSASMIEFLYQKDPYPGDHKYRLGILNPFFKKYFSYAKLGKQNNLSGKDCFRFFWDINSIRRKNKEPDGKLKYFINNIEKLEVTDDKIVMEGVCSTICSPEEARRLYKESH